MSVKAVINGNETQLRELFTRLAVTGVPIAAVDIYQGRNRVVKYRFGDRLVNIKAFRVPIWINRIIYGFIRKSKAQRSYEYAKKLRTMGIPTPEPLGYLEVRKGCLLSQSYYVCEQIEGVRDMRNIFEYRDVSNLLADVAHLIVRMHNQGIWMKDFTPGNLLWRPSRDGHYDLFLVDINRMAFNVTDKRKLDRCFAQLSEGHEMVEKMLRAFYRRG